MWWSVAVVPAALLQTSDEDDLGRPKQMSYGVQYCNIRSCSVQRFPVPRSALLFCSSAKPNAEPCVSPVWPGSGLAASGITVTAYASARLKDKALHDNSSNPIQGQRLADNIFDKFIDLVYSVFAFIHLLKGGYDRTVAFSRIETKPGKATQKLPLSVFMVTSTSLQMQVPTIIGIVQQ